MTTTFKEKDMSFIGKTIKYVVVYPTVAVVTLGIVLSYRPKDEVKIAACIQTHGEQYCDTWGNAEDKATVDAKIAKEEAEALAKIAKEEAEALAKIAKEEAEALQKRFELAVITRLAAEKNRKGFHCLSNWDGSHKGVTNYIKTQLREPDSYEHIETRITPVDSDGNHTLIMQYRARNGFGGMAVELATATVKNTDCSATMQP
jgi:hypothetical protein